MEKKALLKEGSEPKNRKKKMEGADFRGTKGFPEGSEIKKREVEACGILYHYFCCPSCRWGV